jgi:hypothetical protein
MSVKVSFGSGSKGLTAYRTDPALSACYLEFFEDIDNPPVDHKTYYKTLSFLINFLSTGTGTYLINTEDVTSDP